MLDWFVTDRWRLGVLLPDTGLKEPDVSSSSADDQDDRSCKKVNVRGNNSIYGYQFLKLSLNLD